MDANKTTQFKIAKYILMMESSIKKLLQVSVTQKKSKLKRNKEIRRIH